MCFQPVDEKLFRDGGVEVMCRECGHFMIGNELAARLSCFMFHTRAVHQRLQERRQHDPVPVLGAGDEDLLFRR